MPGGLRGFCGQERTLTTNSPRVHRQATALGEGRGCKIKGKKLKDRPTWRTGRRKQGRGGKSR